jgi:hypothetical protein
MEKKENSALPEAQELLEQLRASLAGKDGYIWLEALKKFNRKEIPTWTPATEWKVWRTISNGTFKSADNSIATLRANGIEVYKSLEKAIRKLHFLVFKAYAVEIVIVGITDLGFHEGSEVSYEEIIKAGKKMGLRECISYDVFPIRLSYNDQPVVEHIDEHYLLAMKPMGGGVFSVSNTWGKKGIDIIHPFPALKFNKNAKFFFRLTSKR